jgi:F-type H+-transporting ATPase subunit b
MQINWFTVVAQILNFLLLVWLMKRYLYSPILDAIDKRERRIAGQLEEAESRKTEAENEQREYRLKNDSFDAQKDQLMRKAVAEAKDERQRLLQAANAEAAALRARMEKTWKETEQGLGREIEANILQQVLAVTRKALADLASMSLEEQTVQVFVQRLKEMSDEERKRFKAAFSQDGGKLLVKSAMSLTGAMKADIEKSVNDVLGETGRFQYVTADDLIAGLELSANGYRLAWSISDYLRTLEERLSDAAE